MRAACIGANMKKILMTILALCFAALLCVSLVACNPDGSDGSGGSGQNQYETAKYTVTFNTDGGLALENSTLTGIAYGSYIQPPKDENGNPRIPRKIGYTFKYWSKDGTTEFNFNTTPITANTTLVAKYDANTYIHNFDLTAKLVYNSDGTYDIEENARDEQKVHLGAADYIENETTIKSEYGSVGKLNCPTADEVNGVTPKFCFWYYIAEKDGKKQPVQFTGWKVDSEESDNQVNMLSKYAFDYKLKLYPMFDDNLPEVKVEFRDDPKYSEMLYSEMSYRFGKKIPVSVTGEVNATKNGYIFNYWYYKVETENNDGESTFKEEKFIFDEPEVTATSPMDAAAAPDNFTPVTLSLYAKWTREINISSYEDYKRIYDELRSDDEEVKKNVEDILNATINIRADLTFGSNALEPLFDSEHVFKGVIDGGVYSGGNYDSSNKIIGGLFGNASHASVFGYSDGVIRNIIFEDVMLGITAEDGGKYNDSVYIGGITTVNGGTINNCEITFNVNNGIENLHTVVFGGISAVNRATSKNTTGIITKCNVKIDGFTADCEALTFGGIAGETNASSKISFCTANIRVAEINCTDDGLSSNGRAKLIFGGIAGSNGGGIECSTSKTAVEKAVCLTEFVLGGVAGINMGNIQKTDSDVALCSESAPAKVGGSILQMTCVGGMVGKNEGWAYNSYCNAELYIAVENKPDADSIIAVGGIMGNNFSDKTDKNSAVTSGIGAINSCYSTGQIVVTIGEGIENVAVYAGGIAGRYKQSNVEVCKVGTLFTSVGIDVSNQGKSVIGYLFGEMAKGSSVNAKSFYAKETKLVLNGVTYEKAEDAEKGNFEITSAGTVTDIANFSDANWTVGAQGNESTLGFSGLIWEVREGKLTFVEPRTPVSGSNKN